jgi:hypothetical protein
LSGVYCGALGVEFLSAGKTYGGEMLCVMVGTILREY